MAATALSHAYPLGSRVNERGHLEVGGCDVVELAERYGTPAYIYAEDDMRARARAYVEAFESRTDDFEVIYASKALPITAAYRVMGEEGLSVDVASGGELYLALKAGIDPQRIFMHGNNKTEAELKMAFDVAGRLPRPGLLRGDRARGAAAEPLAGCSDPGHAGHQALHALASCRPGSSTRSSASGSRTGGGGGRAAGARRRSGSTWSGSTPTSGPRSSSSSRTPRTIELLADFIDFDCRLLNVGGGLGIAYTAKDEPASIEDYVDVKVRAVQQAFDPVPRIMIEPGRSLVGNAGITAYRIGTVKEIPGVRTYVSVDGGMSDNLRPMLYGSRYDAAIADRPEARRARKLATIAGMHCESGDILIRDVSLPDPQVGDLLVTPATGAYGYAMANNYNGVPRPPVIFCRDGEARVVVRRETYEDLAARDT